MPERGSSPRLPPPPAAGLGEGLAGTGLGEGSTTSGGLGDASGEGSTAGLGDSQGLTPPYMPRGGWSPRLPPPPAAGLGEGLAGTGLGEGSTTSGGLGDASGEGSIAGEGDTAGLPYMPGGGWSPRLPPPENGLLGEGLVGTGPGDV
jgi:hypothetical protein